jgi:ribonuclease-3
MNGASGETRTGAVASGAGDAVLEESRAKLVAHVESLVGSEPIPRLIEALTHPSFANEAAVADNQRLEFLGDAVLGLCVSEMLALRYPDADEGKLTRMRSALVNAEALASWARRVDLGASIALGRGADQGTERNQTSVLADAAEALIAAIYEARGLEGARALVLDVVGGLFDNAEALEIRDPKSALQERVQMRGLPAPTYRVVGVQGPAHAQLFEVEVTYEPGKVERGSGRSKRIAERAAAASALAIIAPPAPPVAPPAGEAPAEGSDPAAAADLLAQGPPT